eukprot:TRINITY_DN29361_c0_g1_i1.p1 TRINITY_DN29361_c0_g1~~TRINITY_DN29361_c0_g1_i1.p1  ORF type:complete len:485 (-),score=48.69 TRINITY_DN29361_c0_g1_i1:143-1573(-)
MCTSVLPGDALLAVFEFLPVGYLSTLACVHPLWRLAVATGRRSVAVANTVGPPALRHIIHQWRQTLTSLTLVKARPRVTHRELAAALHVPWPLPEGDVEQPPREPFLPELRHLGLVAPDNMGSSVTLSLLQIALAGSPLLSLDLSGWRRLSALTESFSSSAAFRNLQTLNLKGCYQLGPRLTLPSGLTELGLACTNAEPLLPVVVRCCPNLTSLDVTAAKCGDAALGLALRGLPQLETLVARQNPGITSRVLATVAVATPQLKRLVLQGCVLIDDENFERLAECQQLKHISFSECPLVTTHGLEQLLPLRACLRQAELKGCQLRGSGPLLAQFTQLSVLSLENCALIEDIDVLALGPLTHLSTLNLADCGQLTPAVCLPFICRNLPRIRVLNCRNWRMTSSEAGNGQDSSVPLALVECLRFLENLAVLNLSDWKLSQEHWGTLVGLHGMQKLVLIGCGFVEPLVIEAHCCVQVVLR